MCMIYKYKNSPEDIVNGYTKEIDEFAKYLVQETAKGKIPMIITGSGISSSVPSMEEMMNKIEELVEASDIKSYSNTFQRIYSEYKAEKEQKGSELHTLQSRLLTYIQYAYLDEKKRHVQQEDIEKLEKLWTDFILWLLRGEDGRKERPGILKAAGSENHRKIAEMYKEMRAFSITTNFDNLLKKAFKDGEMTPILEKGDFEKYYTSGEKNDGFVEIQARGDVFWVRCTGKYNRVCPNMEKKCYVPGGSFYDDANNITCSICKSPAKVYFAFPGTKEKDAEMSQVMNGVWKFLAYKVSAIIVTGNSMDYDPVLLQFICEMLQKRAIKIFYISRYKVNESGRVGIEKKAATRFLFRNPSLNESIWCRADSTENVLGDIINAYKKFKCEQDSIKCVNNKANEINSYMREIKECIGQKEESAFSASIKRIAEFNYDPKFVKQKMVKEMSRYSQLGLKTYWMEGQGNHYQLHNRYRHSVGVMLLASYLYLKIKDAPTPEELNFLQLAALFHDVGHLPFSHLLEEVFEEFGWIIAGEVKTFNHEEYTKKVLHEIICEDEQIKGILNQGGYTEKDLLQLIGGEFGIGYLDALINSPLDCDKIEYLFSDSIFLGQKSIQDLENFLEDFTNGLAINGNDFLTLSGDSTKAFLKLLEMRGQMYETVYLRSGLRYLEACCKLIIKTFIAFKCTEESLFDDVEKNEKFYNLSWSKINYIICWMKEKLDEWKEKDNICEIYILKKMVEEINQHISISNSMKVTIEECMDIVENTKGRAEVKEIEKSRIMIYDVSKHQFSKAQVRELIKDVYLRFPGILMVDIVQSKAAFSFGNTGRIEQRRDGTKSTVESILIKDIHQTAENRNMNFKCLGDVADEITEELHFPTHTYINIYRITDDLFQYMQAEDFVLSQLRDKGVISYE